jgi:hypothetical protein
MSNNLGEMSKWFEYFEKKHENFYSSPTALNTWLQKRKLVDSNGDACHVLRAFIKDEILGEE